MFYLHNLMQFLDTLTLGHQGTNLIKELEANAKPPFTFFLSLEMLNVLLNGAMCS